MTSDIKQRIYSGLPIALGLLFLLGYANTVLLTFIGAMMSGVAICEYCHLLKKQQIILPQYLMIFCSIMIVSSLEWSPALTWVMVFAKFAWSCFAQEKDWKQDLMFAIGLFWIPLPIAHLATLSQLQEGSRLLILVVFSIWFMDSAAYLGGKRWGKVKLCPEISPGKTVEGTLCGVIAGTLCVILFVTIFIESSNFFEALVLGLTIGIVGQLGDLIESRFKRYCQVKDSGHFLAGHGGLLDRLDSVLPSSVFAYYLIVML